MEQYKNYRDMFTLMREEPQAKNFYENLSDEVRSELNAHAFRVNSFESLKKDAEIFEKSSEG